MVNETREKRPLDAVDKSDSRRKPGVKAPGKKLMGKKGFEALVVLLLAVSMLFVSCQPETMAPAGSKEDDKQQDQEAPFVDDGTTVEAVIAIEEDKSVIVTVPDEVAKYQYRAIPLFEVEGTEGDGTIFGEQLTWRMFTTDEDGRLANMGWYRQGYWQFEIRTLNANGQVLMSGSTQETGNVYLQKGKDNIIKITLRADDGDGRAGQTTDTGKIMFAFETNWLSDNLADQYIRLEVDKFTTDGTIDAHAGRHDTMFPLKNGTEDSRNWGTGALSSYDTSNAVWNDAPDGHPKQAIYGYSDAWTTVKQNQGDTGLLAGTEGFSAVVKDGRIRFYAETPDLIVGTGTGYDDEGNEIEVPTYRGGIPAGRYLVRAKVCTVDRTGGENDGKEIVLGGQTMAVKVVGGETTTVIGSLLQEKYIDTGLSVTIPDSVAGSIASSVEGSDAFLITTDDLSTAAVTLTFNPTKAIAESSMQFSWRVNGDIVQGETGRSFTLRPSKYGDCKVTCVVFGKAGDTGYLGEITSSTVVVRVTEASGPNI